MKRLVFLASLSFPAVAHAGGLLVGEVGAQAMTRGGAFVAKADDPSALAINPAGLVKQHRYAVSISANVIDYSLTFDRSGTYPAQDTMGNPQPSYVGQEYPTMVDQGPIQPVPFLGASQPLMIGPHRFALGEAIYAPQGVPGREFPCEIEEDCLVGPALGPAPQRYDLTDQTALMVLPSIGLAYRVSEQFDVGARFSWGFGNVKARSFTWGLRNDPEDTGADGDFRLRATDTFMPAFGAGVLWRPSPMFEVGLAYASPVNFRGKGYGVAILGEDLGIPGGAQDMIEPVLDSEAACAPGGTIAELRVCLNLDVPQSVTAGGRFIFRDPEGKERGDIELDVRWENWSNASDYTVIVDGRSQVTGIYLKPATIRHGFQDTVAVRLGGAYRVARPVEIRAGVAYDTAAAPDSWTRADIDGKARLTLAAGAGFTIGTRAQIDVGGGAMLEPNVTVTRVDVGTDPAVADREQPDPVQPLGAPSQASYHPINEGRYESGYWFGSVGVTVWF